jgi:hypothetical protein
MPVPRILNACVRWRRALPVVEIKEHRRTLGRRLQQVAESSEHVRADRVALVFSQVLARLAFPRENVEVIEPEVHHHFFELAFAVGRAENLLLHQFHEHQALSARGVEHLGRSHRLRLGLRLTLHCLLASGLLPLPSSHERREEVSFGELARALRQGLKPGKPWSHARISKAFRMELLVDIGLQSHLSHPLNISRPGTEADPIQHVDDSLVGRTVRHGGRMPLCEDGTILAGKDAYREPGQHD